MAKPLLVIMLLLLNVGLLAGNFALSTSLSSAKSLFGAALEATRREADIFQSERKLLAAERCRLDKRLEDFLRKTRTASESAVHASDADLRSGSADPRPPETATDTPAAGIDIKDPQAPEDLKKFFRFLEANGIAHRPDPAALPLLDPTEKAVVEETCVELRKSGLSERAMLEGGLEGLLKDRTWNPGGRQLDDEERAQLERLVGHYRYFSHQRFYEWECFKRYVEGELAGLEEAGIYSEHPRDEAPPIVPGAQFAHMMLRRSQPTYRMLYVFEGDMPEVDHFLEVCKERRLQTFVAIHEFLSRQDHELGP